MKTNLSYNEILSFSKKKMVWIIALSVIVFLHCRIAGIFPLVLSIIGYRNYLKATEKGIERSQTLMKWAFITLIIAAAVTICLMIYLANDLLSR